MPYQLPLLLLSLLLSNIVFAQKGELIAGPMQGHTTDTSTIFWLLVKDAQQIDCQLFNAEKKEKEVVAQQNISLKTENAIDGYHTIHLPFNQLTVANNYSINIMVDGDTVVKQKNIHLFPSFEAEQEAQDFSFLFGSCAMQLPKFLSKTLNYKQHWKIFSRISEIEKDAAFMIWLGDNVYYGKKHFHSYEGMFKKNVKARRDKHLNRFLSTLPHYAIWDDHDYGPNNSNRNYSHKAESLQVFQQFWANPSYGLPDAKGIFTKFSYQDADFFLLDNRYYQSEHKAKNATLLGKQQLEWLKAQLLASQANFKFICMGLQTLTPYSESFALFQQERDALLQFIADEKISGVIFLSGDRHYADLHKLQRPDTYPIYDFTSSPLTSFSNWPAGKKIKQLTETRPDPSFFVKKHNYAKVSIRGEKNERHCILALYNRKNKLIYQHKIPLSELQP